MYPKAYDIILTRSDAIAPFPRLEVVAHCLGKNGLRCLAVGWDREGRHPAIEKRNGMDVVRVHFRGQYGGGIRNLYGLLRWNLHLLALHLKLRPRVIHAYDFDTIIPALIAKAFINCKVVYDIADWYAASRKVGCLRLLVEKAERWVCRKADLVILAHEERLQQLGFSPARWLAIYNIPKEYPTSSFAVTKPANSDYFVYVGVLHPDRGLEQMVEAASALGVRLILAGFGPLETYCRKIANTVPGIEFLGKIPHEHTLMLESNAIAIIALYDPKLPNNRLAAPNKLYEAMMLGRPLVTSKDTLVSQLVEKEKIGIAVSYGNVEELTKALEYLRNNPKEREEMGLRARLLYETRYSYNKQCEKLQHVYKELVPELFTKSYKGVR